VLHSITPTTIADKVSVTAGLLLLCATLLQFVDFPVLSHWLITFAVFYLFVLLLFPGIWLLILPVLVVSVDLTTWSGRFLFNELDLIFITTISYQLIARQFPQKLSSHGVILTGLYVLLYLCQSLSAFKGGGAEIAGPAFGNPYYLDGYTYKVAKGVVWGTLLALRYVRQYQDNKDLTSQYTMVGASLAGIVLFIVILWERGTLGIIFQGGSRWELVASMLDFTSSYRTTGIFSDMHTGGEVIDGIILLFIPFTLYGLAHSHQIGMRLLALTGFTCLAYVTLVGFTRATYSAVAISCVLFFVFGVKHQTHSGKSKLLAVYAGYALIILLAAVLSHYSGNTSGAVAYTMMIVTGATVSFAMTLSRRTHVQIISCILGLGVTIVVGYFSVRANQSNRWITVDSSGTAWTVLSVALLFGVSVTTFCHARLVTKTSRVIAPLLLIVVSAVVSFTLGGYKINERMQDVARDMNTRLTHWNNVFESGADSTMSMIFGNGVGRFPDDYLLSFPETVEKVGSFYINENESGNSLQLGSGHDLAFGQRVQIDANTKYSVKLSYKAEEVSRVAIFLCERNIIFASNFQSNCSSLSQKLPISSEQPATLQININSKNVGKKSIFARWPTVLYIKNQNSGKPITFTRIELTGILDSNDQVNWQLLQNTDFSQGMDHWFFYNDFSHLPWHIKNTWVQAYYDTGLTGLALLTMILIYASITCLRGRSNDSFIFTLVLGPLALAIFGMFGTPLDSARVSWLFYLMLFAAVLLVKTSVPHQQQRERLQHSA
jgi:hypothetical protein